MGSVSSRVRSAPPPLKLELVGCDRLARLRDSLEGLENRALEANPFYGPAALGAMHRHLGRAGEARLLLVREPDGGALLGMMPLMPSRCGPRRLLATSRLAAHRYCFLQTPLIAADHAEAVLDAVIAGWPGLGLDCHALELRGLAAGRLAALLARRAWALQAPWLEVGRSERALFVPSVSAAAYEARALRGKRRKEYARLRRRLAEQGQLRLIVHEQPAAVLASIERFLALEAAGWKGRSGTAILAAGDAAFSRDFLGSLVAAGRVAVPVLQLDGQPLAMLIVLKAAGACGSEYLFKIAYDEGHAAFSPGVLMMLEYGGWRHERGLAGQVDSCAQAGHAMIDRLWPDRRTLIDALLFPPGTLGRAMGAAAAAFHSLRSRLAQTQARANQPEIGHDG